MATVEELSVFFEGSPGSRISQQLGHYKRSGNTAMVDKIMKAKALLKIRRLLKQVEDLK